jgi:hypothetical protein
MGAGVRVGSAVSAAAKRSSANRCISPWEGPHPAEKTAQDTTRATSSRLFVERQVDGESPRSGLAARGKLTGDARKGSLAQDACSAPRVWAMGGGRCCFT